ncbi:hypothetical protein evm_004160 [Chilo suppressalis]|nr:hypothetical protein evm_004160 [Chilo suppressalis]
MFESPRWAIGLNVYVDGKLEYKFYSYKFNVKSVANAPPRRNDDRTTLKGLEQFGRLEELILDNNKLGDNITFPFLPYLRTLSLNNNQVADLELLIDKIVERLPSLSYLSLLSNKACPNELSDVDKDDSDYQRYRYFVLYKLKHLRFLDSRRVSAHERSEAEKRGEFMRVRRPRDVTDSMRTEHSQQSARPLPLDLSALGKHKGAYGKCHYKYTGKHSEESSRVKPNFHMEHLRMKTKQRPYRT